MPPIASISPSSALNTAIYLRAVFNLIVRSNLRGSEQGQGFMAGEALKWTLQIIASVITAVLTALGASSCVNM